MTQDAFFAAVKRGDIAPVYFFQGEEEHIKEHALAALRKRLLPEGLEALNETILQNPPAEAIIESAETLPMMADRRLVLVRDSALLGSGKAAGEAEDSARLVAYLDNPPPSACIVFYLRGMPDGRKKLTQALAKKAEVVKFDRLGDADLQRWIAQQLQRMGKQITREDAAYVSFIAGNELMVLSGELEKVAAHAGDAEMVTRADIDAVVTRTLESNVFEMVDALVAGKEAEAFARLRIMLENGEARIGILAMMSRQYRNLLHLKLMQQGGVPEAELQRRIGVPPFAMRRLFAQSRAASQEELRAKLDLCVDTDYAIKSGKMREDIALERAMIRLCSPGMTA